jgi:hypothetical protein
VIFRLLHRFGGDAPKPEPAPEPVTENEPKPKLETPVDNLPGSPEDRAYRRWLSGD